MPRQLPLSDIRARRGFAHLVDQVARALRAALREEQHAGGKLTAADLARLVGRNKAFISRKLSGEEDMTLRTVAVLAAALGREVDVSLNRIDPPSTTLSNVPRAQGTITSAIEKTSSASALMLPSSDQVRVVWSSGQPQGSTGSGAKVLISQP